MSNRWITKRKQIDMRSIAFDLGTTTGFATFSDGVITSGTFSNANKRFEGGGMRYLRFRQQITEMILLTKPNVVFFEEVRRHLSTDSAHVYGGMMAMLTSVCEEHAIPYKGIPVGTIKKFATGKGNANKEAMLKAAKDKFTDQNIFDDNQADALWILACGREEFKDIGVMPF